MANVINFRGGSSGGTDCGGGHLRACATCNEESRSLNLAGENIEEWADAISDLAGDALRDQDRREALLRAIGGVAEAIRLTARQDISQRTLPSEPYSHDSWIIRPAGACWAPSGGTHAMKTYIVIHPETLEVDVVTESSPGWIVEPTEHLPDPEWSRMAFLVFAQLVELQEKRLADVKGPGGEPVLGAPPLLEPWLVAVAHVMWQGILQGMSWDAVKFAVKKALGRLRSSDRVLVEGDRGVAPGGSHTSTRIGFALTELETGKGRLRSLFIGLQRECGKLPPQERSKLSSPNAPEPSSNGRPPERSR